VFFRLICEGFIACCKICCEIGCFFGLLGMGMGIIIMENIFLYVLWLWCVVCCVLKCLLIIYNISVFIYIKLILGV